MSVTSGFFNSLNGDRKYNATNISKLFDGLINDGIYMSVGEAFVVKTSSGMNVVVKPGRAWFNHTWTLNDSDLLLTVEPSELLFTRIDAVVIEVNNMESIRANTIKIIKGEASEIPLKPVLTKSENVNQYALAYITVEPKVTVINQAKIENVVGTSETPFVNALVESIDTSKLYAQFTAQFNDWFLTIQDSVTDNAVLDLSVKMADLTKSDNSVPTLLYRYTLFPETLTEAEKTKIESDPNLVTLINERKHVHFGDILLTDTRNGIPEGFLKCDGSIVQREDYPEYAESTKGASYLQHIHGSGGRTVTPWYEADSGTSYTADTVYQAVDVREHCTCNGYTALLVNCYSAGASAAAQDTYTKIMIFNPKGEKIFSSNILSETNGYLRSSNKYKSSYRPFYYTSNYSNCMYFEDANTVKITIRFNDAVNSGILYLKLRIDGDAVTIQNKNKLPLESYSYSAYPIPGTDAVVIMSQTSTGYNRTENGTPGNTSSNTRYQSFCIKDAITGAMLTTEWISRSMSKDSANTADYEITASQIDSFYPNSDIVKFTNSKGIMICHYSAYCGIPFGSVPTSNPTYTSGSYWGTKGLPSGCFELDLCAKKRGDEFPYKNGAGFYKMSGKTYYNDSKGTFIGSMLFESDPEYYDIYVINEAANVHYLCIYRGETRLSKQLIENMIPEYASLNKPYNYLSAKNFIIVGHTLYLFYPNDDSSYKNHTAPAEQNKHYLAMSINEIQLPNLNINDAEDIIEAIIRVK